MLSAVFAFMDSLIGSAGQVPEGFQVTLLPLIEFANSHTVDKENSVKDGAGLRIIGLCIKEDAERSDCSR